MAELKCEAEQFQGRIIFMSMLRIPSMYEHTLKKVPARMLVISGTWLREEVYGTHVSNPDGEWDKTAESMGELKKQRERKEVHSFTSTEVKKPLNVFFALLFLSTSSVSTEQFQICAKN